MIQLVLHVGLATALQLRLVSDDHLVAMLLCIANLFTKSFSTQKFCSMSFENYIEIVNIKFKLVVSSMSFCYWKRLYTSCM